MGTSHIFPGYWDDTALIVVVCSSLAGYNALELILLIFTTFSTYKGLYFWSLVIATVGLLPYIIGLTVFYFDYTSTLFGLIINNFGWIAVVVGQSVVLYSRLGVVLGKLRSRILFYVKWMIIIDAFVFYIQATTVVFAMHYSKDPGWRHAYVYTERIQMTGFCIQEFIISGLYIWKTIDILKDGEKKLAHRTLRQLLTINVIIVGLDIGLLVLEYLSLEIPEIAFKALAYSVKLKLEFAILRKLVEVSDLTRRQLSFSLNADAIIDDDNLPESRPNAQSSTLLPAQPPDWPAFKPSEMKDGDDKEESTDSVKSTSNHTESSDQQSSQLGLAPVALPCNRHARNSEPDAYHEMIKVISTV